MANKKAPAASPLDQLRKLCLDLPDTWEKISHGEPTFFVKKRSFAMFASADNHHGGGRYAVWCKATHTTQDLLVSTSPERYFVPPYAGPAGWVGIYLDRRPKWSDVADRLAHAHELAIAAQGRRGTRDGRGTKNQARRTTRAASPARGSSPPRSDTPAPTRRS